MLLRNLAEVCISLQFIDVSLQNKFLQMSRKLPELLLYLKMEGIQALKKKSLDSKTYEKIMLNRLYEHLSVNNICILYIICSYSIIRHSRKTFNRACDNAAS